MRGAITSLVLLLVLAILMADLADAQRRRNCACCRTGRRPRFCRRVRVDCRSCNRGGGGGSSNNNILGGSAPTGGGFCLDCCFGIVNPRPAYCSRVRRDCNPGCGFGGIFGGGGGGSGGNPPLTITPIRRVDVF